MTTPEDFACALRAIRASPHASGTLRALWAEVQALREEEAVLRAQHVANVAKLNVSDAENARLREDLRIAREDAEEQARELTRLTGMTYGSTHHDGCWDTVDARHHLCTLEKARELAQWAEDFGALPTGPTVGGTNARALAEVKTSKMHAEGAHRRTGGRAERRGAHLMTPEQRAEARALVERFARQCIGPDEVVSLSRHLTRALDAVEEAQKRAVVELERAQAMHEALERSAKVVEAAQRVVDVCGRPWIQALGDGADGDTWQTLVAKLEAAQSGGAAAIHR